MTIKKSFAKASTGLATMALTLLIFVQGSTLQGAAISNTVVTDDVEHLKVTWSGVLTDGQNNTLDLPTLVNWDVGPNPITLTYLGGGLGWSGPLTAQHISEPHPGVDGIPGGLQLFTFAFTNTSSGSYSSSGIQGHGPHYDVYTLNYEYTVGTNAFTAELTGAHVPEPASFAIFCLGTVGAVVRAKLRRKKVASV
ncbi:MAG: PEP-CTERM sorting domain-containing protein [Planctomycetota bacterium]